VTDVLIVGAGSAGSVLAERLSTDPDCRVTVIEAGPDLANPAIRSLIGDATVLPIAPDSPVVHRYRTELTDDPMRLAEIVRGACVGGSGAINGGYFCRALPRDFDTFAGWSWTEAAEHYDAVEKRIGVVVTAEFATGTREFLTAAQETGYRWLPSLATDATGLAAVPLNITGGVRNGPGTAFLTPALSRPNLTLLSGITVTRIRMDAGRATGVDAIGARGPVALDADRVVLSAGAIATAHLLMLSGIGPAGELAAQGIGVVSDLAVGQRCWDHPEWVIPTRWTASVGRPVLEAVLVTDDLEVRPYTTGFGVRPEPSIGVALMRPRARGSLSLVSADPTVPPRISHHYDCEPDDLAALQCGCDLVTEIISSTTELGEPDWSTSQHLCGTAPVGTEDDDHAVVDPQCRVRGVDNLWVVDGSVLPTPLGRGPHATIAMIGHRAAEFVR
jgi:predicted dehydrogenase (TIGR03970 family)